MRSVDHKIEISKFRQFLMAPVNASDYIKIISSSFKSFEMINFLDRKSKRGLARIVEIDDYAEKFKRC